MISTFIQRKSSVHLLVLVALIALLVFVAPTSTARVTLDFLDVGQGDAILIRSAVGGVVLIDGGTEQAGRDRLLPFLKDAGIEKIDVMIATHPHADHIGGLIPVIESLPVGQIWADGQVHTTRTYERFLEAILARNIPFYAARSGDHIVVAGIDSLRVLHPVDELLPGLNNNSVVVRLGHAGVYALFTGDVEREGEIELLGRHSDIYSEILKVAHHGSSSSSSPEFLTAVNPEVSVIMLGATNTYGHPHREILERLDSLGTNVLRTDQDGTIRIILEEGTWQQTVVEAAPALSITRSSASSLQSIPGIGPVLADRIVVWRKSNTADTWDDLLEVPGIGPATLRTIQEHAQLH